MRFLGRSIVLLALLAIFGSMALPVWEAWNARGKVDLTNPLFEIASPTVVQNLYTDRWLDFRLGDNSRKIRLLTNANVNSDLATDVVTPRHYAIRYQLLNNNGELIDEKVHHMRTRMNRFVDRETNREFSSSFYLDPDEIPMSSRSINLALDPDQNAEILRARIESQADTISSIVLRVYQPELIPDEQLDKRWGRLAYRKRQALADKTVYSQGLLRKAEKRNLLRNRMKPIGPIGIENVDYKQKLLYVVREHDGELVDDPILPEGANAIADVESMIHIPHPGGHLHLMVNRLPAPADVVRDASEPIGAVLQWFGEDPGEYGTTMLSLTSGETSLEFETAPGLVGLKFNADVIYTARLTTADGDVDVTPQPRRVRTWHTNNTDPLEFNFDTQINDSIPVRIDVRQKLPELESTSIRMELLDDNGSTVTEYSLDLASPLSAYDYRSSDKEISRSVSEPARRYLRLPPNVTKMRVHGAEGNLVSVYTRPAKLTHRTMVPENYQVSPAQEIRESRLPVWFQIKPVNARDRLDRELMTLITVQPRPPEQDPQIAAGQYRFDPFEPSGQWKARHIYIARRANAPTRPESVASVHQIIPINQSVKSALVATPGRASVTPVLRWQQGPDAPFTLEVSLDGRSVLTEEVFGEQGQIRLPPTRAGDYTLHVRGAPPGTQLLMSNLAPRPGHPGWIRRLAYRTDSRRLSFVYPKKTSDIEVLTGTLHLPERWKNRRTTALVTIRARARTRGLTQSMTLVRRHFDLASGDTVSDFATGVSGQSKLLKGTSFFVPLAQDLPPGEYEIDIRLEDATDGYLSLYRLVPGKHEHRKFFVELDLQDADSG